MRWKPAAFASHRRCKLCSRRKGRAVQTYLTLSLSFERRRGNPPTRPYFSRLERRVGATWFHSSLHSFPSSTWEEGLGEEAPRAYAAGDLLSLTLSSRGRRWN